MGLLDDARRHGYPQDKPHAKRVKQPKLAPLTNKDHAARAGRVKQRFGVPRPRSDATERRTAR